MDVGEQLPVVRRLHWTFFAPIAGVLVVAVVLLGFNAPSDSTEAFLFPVLGGFAFGLCIFSLYIWSLRRSVRKLRRVMSERNPGLYSFPVRSSASLRDVVEELTGSPLPRRAVLGTYLVFVDQGDRAELWRMSRGGPALAVRIPWNAVHTVVAGYVAYPDADERAIVLSGRVRERLFVLGLTPQNIDGLLPHAASDVEYLELLYRLQRSHPGAVEDAGSEQLN